MLDKEKKIIIIKAMADLNLGHLISKFVNYQAVNAQRQAASNKPAPGSFSPAPQPAAPASGASQSAVYTRQTANMAGIDQSVYVKEMMNLPKNLNELLYILQKKYYPCPI